jgi:hypothetical protein
MAIIVKDNGGSYEQPEAGMHPAVCAKVFDLGDQLGFQGRVQHQIVILWELAERQTKGDFTGKRFKVTKKYTASLNEKANLRKDLDSWRGRPFTDEEAQGFDMEKLLNVNCLLNIAATKTKKGNTFMAVASVNPMMKGQEKLEVEDVGYVPKFVKDILDKGTVQPSVDNFEDDIPF